jgi:primosomal protein N' (replication factor Y)
MSSILLVALPTPLRRLFEYLPPPDFDPATPLGVRVRVPFGRQTLIGILVGLVEIPQYPADKLRPAELVLDRQPVLPEDILALCRWAADYYQHPLGEVLHAALPVQMRKTQAEEKPLVLWRHTTAGKGLPEQALKRSPHQQHLHQMLLQHGVLSEELIQRAGIPRAVVRKLAEKGLIVPAEATDLPLSGRTAVSILAEPPQVLTVEQQVALDHIRYHNYSTYLLQGTTGSGKTEVYLHAIARALQAGRQALMLVPEIGLAPQTLQRFQNRFAVVIVQLHSAVAEAERTRSWRAAASGAARIVIGTRLAVFTPMPDLGLIILDEEHDQSFKQQDGLRYSARDLAVMRAFRASVPLLLGSATPSLESLHNALQGRYQHLHLTRRAGGAQVPHMQLIDMRREESSGPIAATALEAMRGTLAQGEQVLVFLNRRGYAPALLCRQCGWVANCTACTARLTLHSQPRHLRCHHCDLQRPVPNQCPSCHNTELTALGQGTERCEIVLQEHFPGTEILRVDQDSMSRKNAMRALAQKLELGQPCILIGTQMLAKGHHFPKVTLAVLLDIDQGLFNGDFRGPERMGQQLIQVAGRAGRGELPGSVLLQTYQPDHPLLQILLNETYTSFARTLLQERFATRLPPVWAMAMLRAESKRAENAVEFLHRALTIARTLAPPSPQRQYLGPLPALMEKRHHRFRYQLHITCAKRTDLQALLKDLVTQLDQLALAQRVRWSVDVDPQDMS